MKKLLLYVLTMVAAFVANAQNPSFSPAVFTAEDQVTLTVDVTGTGMAGATEAFIWIFSNQPPPSTSRDRNGIVNGVWSNSDNAAKMVAAGTNKWSFTFTGTTLFNLSPAELKEFGFVVKSKDGTKQTGNFEFFKFEPLVFIPTVLRVFPARVGKQDVVQVNFDQSLSDVVNEQRMTPTTVTVTLFDGTTQVGAPVNLPVTKAEGKRWIAYFLASRTFSISASTRVTRFTYQFNGTVPDVNGAPAAVSSSVGEGVFTSAK